MNLARLPYKIHLIYTKKKTIQDSFHKEFNWVQIKFNTAGFFVSFVVMLSNKQTSLSFCMFKYEKFKSVLSW